MRLWWRCKSLRRNNNERQPRQLKTAPRRLEREGALQSSTWRRRQPIEGGGCGLVRLRLCLEFRASRRPPAEAEVGAMEVARRAFRPAFVHLSQTHKSGPQPIRSSSPVRIRLVTDILVVRPPDAICLKLTRTRAWRGLLEQLELFSRRLPVAMIACKQRRPQLEPRL